MRLQFNARVTADAAALDTAIRAISTAEIAGHVVAYAATAPGGGLSAYKTTMGGGLQFHDSAPLPSDLRGAPENGLGVGGADDDLALFFPGSDGDLMARALTADGGLSGALPPIDLPAGPQTVRHLDHLPDPGGAPGGTLALTDAASGVQLYHLTGARTVTDVGQLAGPALSSALGRGVDDVLVTTVASDTVRGVFLSSGGALGPVAEASNDGSLAMTAPTAIETVSAYGAQFSIVAAAGTGSLTVLDFDDAGTARIRDHVIDTRATRFADVQDIAVAKVAGQAFVLAGGSDDGISLFTLLPDGRLAHLDSIATSVGAGLDGITTLAARHAHDTLHVFAATQGDRGLAHLAMPAPGNGEIRRGEGTLEGGAGRDMLVAEGSDDVLLGRGGDDHLVAGPSGGELTGGAGGDVFVLRGGGGSVRITDFEAGTDRLDLSDFTMLRSPGQLDISETSTGARIRYRGEDVRIDSHDGAPIAADSLFARAFEWPDRIGTMVHDDSQGPGPDPDPPPPDDGGNPGTGREIRIGADQPEPWLAGADVTFSSQDGSDTTVQADSQGRIDLSGVAGESGRLHILRQQTTGDAAIGVDDALDVLRLAVGLDPGFGPADQFQLAAADIDRDGSIGVDDALDVLRVAVGLGIDTPPQWLFLDTQTPASDPGEIAQGLDLTVADTGDWSLSATAILTGNLDGGI